jgi:hypothetical protein
MCDEDHSKLMAGFNRHDLPIVTIYLTDSFFHVTYTPMVTIYQGRFITGIEEGLTRED